jgi:hypothetical protein
MAYQKLQAGSAIPVVPSDTISIPAGDGVQLSSQADGTTPSKLVDSTQSFTTSVKVGYIVHNTTDGTIATVTAIDSNTQLSISADIMANTEDYTIYAAPETNGCALYVGVAGDVKVKMASGKDVVFTAMPAGSFMPVNVLKVFATGTTATNIVALW